MSSTEIDIADGLTTNVPSGNHIIKMGSNDTVTIGGGTIQLTAGNNDTITALGLGNSTLALGSNDTFITGDGNEVVTGGANSTITTGNGVNTITVGANSKVTVGSGNNQITAGPNSTIKGGNGVDGVHAGHDSIITLGSGPDTVSAGTQDTISTTVGSSKDNIKYDALSPKFTVPASTVMVQEEQSVALPIALLPPNFGAETISGFKPVNSIIYFDTQDFSNYAAVKANSAQVGANVVITQPGGSGTITLINTSLSSLSSSNFGFFTGATDTVTISGVPTDATLNHGTQTSPGTWSLTPSQLNGLVLNAGEPIGFPTPDQITVTITNPSGQQATTSQSFGLVVSATPPTVGVSVLGYETNDPVTETRLQLSSLVDDPDGGKDSINRFHFTGVAAGTTLTASQGTLVNDGGGAYDLFSSGNPASFNPELDVTTASGQTTNFTLGITAYSDEPNSAEVSASTSQKIDVEYSTNTQTPDFTSSGQSIWVPGAAFSHTFDNFLGISTSLTPTITVGALDISQTFGVTANLTAGFQSALHVNGGSFSGQLPFNVTTDNTYNVDNKALEVDPTSSQAGGGSFSTTGPSGSYQLDLLFKAYVNLFTSGVAGTTNTVIINIKHTFNLIDLQSSSLHGSFQLPDGAGTVAFSWPNISTSGSNPNPGTITSSATSNPVLTVNLDPIAIVLDAIFGDDPLKGSLFGGDVKYTLLAATLAPSIDLAQTFALNATLPGGTITPDGGTGQAFSFGSPVIIPNSDGEFSLSLDPNATLTNDTNLAGQLEIGVRALKGSVSVAGLTTSFGPVLHPHTTIGPGNLANLYNNTFNVTFNHSTIAVAAA